MRLLQSIKNKISHALFGRLKLQPFLEKCYPLYLQAMGYGIGTEVFSSGEKYVLDHIRNTMNKNGQGTMVVFDVGANVGNYTKLLIDTLGDNLSIFAFEPSSRTYTQLTKNVPPDIKTFNLGFSNREEKTTLYGNDKNSLTASLYKRHIEGSKHSFNVSENVEMQTIDNFCRTHNISRIDFLKLDTEGNELKCLEGASKMIRENRIDFIQFEFGGCNIDSKTFFRDFYNLLHVQYTIYRVMQRGLYEVRDAKETREIFITTNYLAERRAA